MKKAFFWAMALLAVMLTSCEPVQDKSQYVIDMGWADQTATGLSPVPSLTPCLLTVESIYQSTFKAAAVTETSGLLITELMTEKEVANWVKKYADEDDRLVKEEQVDFSLIEGQTYTFRVRWQNDAPGYRVCDHTYGH